MLSQRFVSTRLTTNGTPTLLSATVDLFEFGHRQLPLRLRAGKSRTYRMDPEEGTMTPALGTGRHPVWDVEVGEPVPHTGLVDAEDCEVLGLYLRSVGLVCNRERTALHVVDSRCVHRAGRERAIIRRAWVVALLEVGVALGRCPVRGMSLVACDLSCGGLSCREVEDVSRVGRVVEMPVEPPLIKGHVHERLDGAIVVRKRVVRDVEAIHARMPDRCGRNSQLRRTRA